MCSIVNTLLNGREYRLGFVPGLVARFLTLFSPEEVKIKLIQDISEMFKIVHNWQLVRWK